MDTATTTIMPGSTDTGSAPLFVLNSEDRAALERRMNDSIKEQLLALGKETRSECDTTETDQQSMYGGAPTDQGDTTTGLTTTPTTLVTVATVAHEGVEAATGTTVAPEGDEATIRLDKEVQKADVKEDSLHAEPNIMPASEREGPRKASDEEVTSSEIREQDISETVNVSEEINEVALVPASEETAYNGGIGLPVRAQPWMEELSRRSQRLIDGMHRNNLELIGEIHRLRDHQQAKDEVHSKQIEEVKNMFLSVQHSQQQTDAELHSVKSDLASTVAKWQAERSEWLGKEQGYLGEIGSLKEQLSTQSTENDGKLQELLMKIQALESERVKPFEEPEPTVKGIEETTPDSSNLGGVFQKPHKKPLAPPTIRRSRSMFSMPSKASTGASSHAIDSIMIYLPDSGHRSKSTFDDLASQILRSHHKAAAQRELYQMQPKSTLRGRSDYGKHMNAFPSHIFSGLVAPPKSRMSGGPHNVGGHWELVDNGKEPVIRMFHDLPLSTLMGN